MENNSFITKSETQKRDKLLRILSAKLPSANKEDLVKIIASLNLKRQYNIRICKDINHLRNLAVVEKIENKEDIDGVDWASATETLVKVVMGDITPGKFINVDGKDDYKEAQIGESRIYAFIQEKYNAGYLDVSKPDYENYLYIYQP